MKIKWLGHASFLFTDNNNIRILTDPYTTEGHFADTIKFTPLDLAADIVTISHEHEDHNFTSGIKGNPEILRESKTVKGITFKAISAAHDDSGGSQRGKNRIFCFSIDGVRVCHLGDLGHQLNDQQVAAIGEVDVLLIPVGGFFTIDAAAANKIAEVIKPRVIIPMHFKNEKCFLPIVGVENFLEGKQNVTRANTSEIEYQPGTLPARTQIVVLQPAN